MKTLAQFYRWLDEQADASAKTLASFSRNVAATPSYSLRWSMGAFEAAAMADLALCFKGGRDAGSFSEEDMPKILREAQSRALRAARSPARSTSPVANLMEQEEGAAWARLAEFLGDGS